MDTTINVSKEEEHLDDIKKQGNVKALYSSLKGIILQENPLQVLSLFLITGF